MVNQQQRESYRQALEAWKLAARDAQSVKDRLYNAPTNPNDMYLVTSDDMRYLQREYDQYQRLAGQVRNL